MELISHCVKRSKRIFEGRATLGLLLILLALSMLGWIYLSQASHVATTSRRVGALEAEKEDLQRIKMGLITQIAQAESVERLATRAQELGFVPADPSASSFVVVGAEHEVVEQVPPDEGTAVARWMDNVSAQFLAWVNAEER